MNEPMTVARATGPSTADLRGLLDDFLRTIGEPALDQDSFARILKAIEDDRIRFYIARTAGSPVGMCSMTIGFSTYRASPFGLLEDFYVVPSCRGTGVARCLIEFALADAQASGCRSVMGACGDDDVPMWKHFGFKKIGNLMAIDVSGQGPA